MNGRTAVLTAALLISATCGWGQEGPQRPGSRITFEMRDKLWVGGQGSVLEWLSEQTGLPVSISRAKPSGTLTFTSLQMGGAAKQYTLAEVIDILDDELSKQKLILVRRAKTFTIEPVDEKIDPAALPRVLPEELEQYGNTEAVSVVFSLTGLVAEDFAKEVKMMLAPLGVVVPLAHANKLVVQDTVASLKRIRAIVKDNSQGREKAQNGCLFHPCQYVPARHAARILNELLGDPKELIQALQAQLSVRDSSDGEFGGQFGAPVDVSHVRMHYISVDERRNLVLVTGPADKIAQAEAILKKIDLPQNNDQRPVQGGSFRLRVYPIPGDNAGLLAKGLQEIYKSVPEVRIAAVANHSLMVWAGPTEHAEILAHIRASREQNNIFEVIPLNTLDASDTADTLKGMLGGDAKSGAAYIRADTKRNALVTRGTPYQISDIKVALKALGEGSASPPASTAVVLTIEEGSAATRDLAEALERMLPQLLQNPVQLFPFGGNEPNGSRPAKSGSVPPK